MNIERRNISSFKFSLLGCLFSILTIVWLGYFNIDNLFIFFFIFGLIILVYSFKTRELKTKEIQYLEEKSELIIENEKSDWGTAILFLANMLFILSISSSENLLFSISIVALIMGGIFYYIRYANAKLILKEKLLITSTQVVFLARGHTVINIEDIQEVILGKLTTIIKEKHGELKLEVEKIDDEKKNSINAKLKSIAVEHSIKLDERNIWE